LAIQNAAAAYRHPCDPAIGVKANRGKLRLD
jgi:hypothetical protein